MNKWLRVVVDHIEEIKKLHPDEEMFRNGDICYANGNDGTDFDWAFNDRICELGCCDKNDERWIIKTFVYKDGEAVTYVYHNGAWDATAEYSKYLFDEYGAKCLYNHMMYAYDRKEIFDEYIVDVEGKRRKPEY